MRASPPSWLSAPLGGRRLLRASPRARTAADLTRDSGSGARFRLPRTRTASSPACPPRVLDMMAARVCVAVGEASTLDFWQKRSQYRTRVVSCGFTQISLVDYHAQHMCLCAVRCACARGRPSGASGASEPGRSRSTTCHTTYCVQSLPSCLQPTWPAVARRAVPCESCAAMATCGGTTTCGTSDGRFQMCV